MRPVKMTTLRRFSQIVFFLLFLFLLLHTEFRGSLQAAGNEIRLPYPIRWFFEIDPLVAVSNVLSSRALYRGLLWSLVILIPTMFLGRFFCGWICPLGSLHHFFGSLRSERRARKAVAGIEPVQALADHEVLPPVRLPGGCSDGYGRRWVDGPSVLAGAIAGVVDPAGNQLCLARGPAQSGSQPIRPGRQPIRAGAKRGQCIALYFRMAAAP